MTYKPSLADLRHMNRMSQKVLAGLAGISQNTLSNIERLAMSPKLSQLIKIAEAMGYRLEIELKEKE